MSAHNWFCVGIGFAVAWCVRPVQLRWSERAWHERIARHRAREFEQARRHVARRTLTLVRTPPPPRDAA
jgi:hypothetical protein